MFPALKRLLALLLLLVFNARVPFQVSPPAIKTLGVLVLDVGGSSN